MKISSRSSAMLLLTLGTSFGGCSREGSDHGQLQLTPKRSGDSATVIGNASGTGLVGQSLVIDLDTPPNPSTWAMTACLSGLPADFVIGEATCRSDASKKTAVVAGHAKQFCSSNLEYGPRAEPSRELAIDGCDTFDIAIYNFKPNFKVTVKPEG